MTFKSSYRALLTETLPYEVPVIFSNEVLYASSLAPPRHEQAALVLAAFRKKLDRFTVPFQYRIRKGESSTTTLSIIHPGYQLNIAEFYDHYHQSIISYCGRSDVSLRKPVEVVDVFSENKLSKGKTLKLGIPHIEAADGDTEAGHVTSFFAYSRFNLLGRFVESKDFRDLELSFPVLRTIDISKCFSHIYTHSVTWASKGKGYAKHYAEVHSFEGRFDRLMQGANYNETNGIVIGPEISRIFAEIILQDVDVALADTCRPLLADADYSVRRYVDDYFIFARTEEIANSVQRALEESLESYKLFINNAKTETKRRPFVSRISLARDDVAGLLSRLHSSLDDLTKVDLAIAARKAKAVSKYAFEVRLISERHNISISAVSGWLMSQLRVLLRRALNVVRNATDEPRKDIAEDIAGIIVDAAFYVCAIDMRVRSTYSLCQFIASIADAKGEITEPRAKRLLHRVELGLEQLVSQARRNSEVSELELQNLLITGAHLVGDRFLRSKVVVGVFDDWMSRTVLSYFDYVTLKFCFLKDPTRFAANLLQLNTRVEARLQSEADSLGTSSELYLLACDYLSSPDVSHGAKRLALRRLVGGIEPSNAAIDELTKHIGLVDWSGLRIKHLLARKELRPVYAWA